MDGTGLALGRNDSLVAINGSAYVDFEGFEVRNSSGRGITVYDSAEMSIRDNDVHHTSTHPIMGAGDGLLFEGNHVHDGILSNRNSTGGGGWPGGISTWTKSDGSRSTRVTIRANVVEDTWGEGIIPMHVNGGVVQDNVVHDVWSVGIYVIDCSAVDVDGNYVYSTDATFNRNGRPADGVLIANEPGSGQLEYRYARTSRSPTT